MSSQKKSNEVLEVIKRDMATIDPPHIAAHKHCKRHRTEILASERCGCFYCLAIFDPSEIPEWLDESSKKGGVRDRFSDRVSVWLSDHA